MGTHRHCQGLSFALTKLSRVSVAAAFLVVPTGFGAPSAIAIRPLLPSETLLQAPQTAIPQLAQANANSITYFTTANYTVHVFRDGTRRRMNVYENALDLVRLNRADAAFAFENGQATYRSFGSLAGNTVTYKVLINSANQPRLQILDAGDRPIVNEAATGDALVELPEGERPTDVQETILSFETTTYATRVFRRNNQYFMNVYNKFTRESEVNGAAANLAPNRPPYERTVSYVSSGNRGGFNARYFARIDGTGQTTLEIFSANDQRIFQEPGVGPVTVNIPQRDLPAGIGNLNAVTNAYVAAVFGSDGTLREVQRLYPEAFIEDSSLGRFINAGAFSNRDLANARVSELRGRGFNARLVYRDVRYR